MKNEISPAHDGLSMDDRVKITNATCVDSVIRRNSKETPGSHNIRIITLTIRATG